MTPIRLSAFLRLPVLTIIAAACLPAQVSFTIASNPTAQAFTVTGTGCSAGAYTAPATLNWTPGSSCTVTFATPQAAGTGTRYAFNAWQDSVMSNPRTIVVPALGTAFTYTASFNTQYLLTVLANPANGGTVSGGGWYDADSPANVSATPNAGYYFANWIPAISNNQVFVNGPMTLIANFAVLTSLPVPPSPYTVTLIANNATAGTGRALNNFGQVVGTATLANGTSAFLWAPAGANATNGTLTDLGGLNGSSTPYNAASGINDVGQVVGSSSPAQASPSVQPFLWTPTTSWATSGSMAAFLGSIGIGETALTINSFGQIAVPPSQLWTPLSPNGNTGTIYNFPSYSVKRINDFGQTIGDPTYIPHDAAYSVIATPSVPNGIPPLPATIGGRAYAINNYGAVVANHCYVTCTSGTLPTAFLWTPTTANQSRGTSTDIPLPAQSSMQPLALNLAEQVVGSLGRPNMDIPFLYSGATVYDLSAVSAQLSGGTAVAINDVGQIVINANGSVYLLTPQPPPSQAPAPVAANPQSGSGATQTMTFTFNDPRGWQDVGVVNVLMNNFIDGRSACYLAYSVPLSTLYLVNDAGQAGGPYAGSVTLGNSGTIQNSQCRVGLTSATGSGNTLLLTLAVTFTPSFAGDKIVYAAARDVAQNNSGWLPMGVWQVPGSPVGGSMNPASGVGLGPTSFAFGFAVMGIQNILINTALDGRHACYLAYVSSINTLYLVNDKGDALLPGQSMNSAGILSNSQCSVTWSGLTAGTLNLNIGFSPGFGPNLIFYQAARFVDETNNTGWLATGTWLTQ
jgi:probable HAF family extracellular repeat protein